MLRAKLLLAIACVLALHSAHAQRNVPVPASCTPQVNQKLFDLLSSGQHSNVDNVMVCGITTSSSRTQRGGAHPPNRGIGDREQDDGGADPCRRA